MPVNSDYKVSVIVPVYNVEQYLSDCLESICRQTLKGIEIIVVNDGSTDNSLSIIKSFQQKYSNIKLINKKNGGLSSARNAGIDMAVGEYLFFVDSDDFIDLDTLEKMYVKAKETHCPLIYVAYCSIGRTIKRSCIKNVFQIKNLFMMQTFYTSCNFLDVWDVSVVISCIKGKYGSLIHYVSGRGIIMRI